MTAAMPYLASVGLVVVYAAAWVAGIYAACALSEHRPTHRHTRSTR